GAAVSLRLIYGASEKNPMSKTSLFISSLASAAAIGGLVYWLSSGEETPAPADFQRQSANVIAHDFQRPHFDSIAPAALMSACDKYVPTKEAPADRVGISRILRSIKLDEFGRVFPEQTLKEALEQGFDEWGPNLTPAAMSELQDSIRVGLPGPAGDEAA